MEASTDYGGTMAEKQSRRAGRRETQASVGVLDDTDALLVDSLERDGRATLSRLAELTGLSVSAVQSRVRRLEEHGVITGYKAIVDAELRGLPLGAFVSVTPLDYSREEQIPKVLSHVDGATACYSVAGSQSFILRVRVASPGKLEELLNRIHREVPVSTESSVILQTYFER